MPPGCEIPLPADSSLAGRARRQRHSMTVVFGAEPESRFRFVGIHEPSPSGPGPRLPPGASCGRCSALGGFVRDSAARGISERAASAARRGRDPGPGPGPARPPTRPVAPAAPGPRHRPSASACRRPRRRPRPRLLTDGPRCDRGGSRGRPPPCRPGWQGITPMIGSAMLDAEAVLDAAPPLISSQCTSVQSRVARR